MAAASSSGAAKPDKLCDQSWQDLTSLKACTFARTADTDIDIMVEKKLYDNLRDMTDEQVDGIVDGDGRTMRQTLKLRCQAWQDNKKLNPLGAKFYKELRATFKSRLAISSQLTEVVEDSGGEVQPVLMEAAVRLQKSNNKHAFLSAVKLLKKVSKTDAVGIAQFVITIKAHTSKDNLALAIDALKTICELQINTLFPDVATLMKDWAHTVFLEDYKKAKDKKDSKPSAFITKHKPYIWLALPQIETEAITEASDWADCGNATFVVCRTPLGKKLFGFARFSVLLAQANEILDKDLKEFFVDRVSWPISRGALTGAVHKCYAKIAAIDGISDIPDKRMATITYLGEQVKAPVRSMLENVERAFAGQWKTLAVLGGVVPQLFGEQQFMNSRVSLPLNVCPEDFLEESLYAGTIRARELLCCEDGRFVLTSADVLKRFADKASETISHDPYIDIERYYFDGMAGEEGERRMCTRFLALLPTENNAVELGALVQAMATLQESRLSKFCAQEVKVQVNIAIDAMNAVAEGRQPSLRGAYNKFLTEVQARIQYFARYKKGTSSGVEVFGSQAVAMCISDAKAKGDECTEADVALANEFEWMVTHEDKITLKQIVEGFEKQIKLEAALHGVDGPAAKKLKTGGKGSAKSKEKGGAEFVQAALDMFKVKKKPA